MLNRLSFTTAATIVSAAILSGCAASIPPVQVTRFHLGSAIVRAPVAPVALDSSLERAGYDAAVARQLARLGFAPGGAEARYTFSTEVTRDPRQAPPKPSGWVRALASVANRVAISSSRVCRCSCANAAARASCGKGVPKPKRRRARPRRSRALPPINWRPLYSRTSPASRGALSPFHEHQHP